MAKVYGGKLNAISRGLKLHRVDMKILRGIPSNEWTPIFEALTTFASYYGNFTPSGSNSTLEIAFYKQGSKIQTIAFGDASAFSIALDASDVLTFNLISNVELNGVPATSGVTTVPDGYYVLTGDLDITSDVKYYAANATPANFFGIQIHSMKNLDNYDTGRNEYPVNGRDVVELDGLTQYGEIPAWGATNGVIEFDFVWGGANPTWRNLIDARELGTGFISISSAGYLTFLGWGGVKVDGEAVNSGVFKVTPSKAYGVTLQSESGNVISKVGTSSITTEFLDGFLANLRLTDLDNPSNSRYYPLDRADIIQDVNEPDFPELWVPSVANTTAWGDVEGTYTKIVTGWNALGETVAYGTVPAGTYRVICTIENQDGNLGLWTRNSENTSNTSIILQDGVNELIVHVPIGGLWFDSDSSVGAVISNVSIKQTTDGNWINAPQAVHRPNNSIDINTVKRSKDAPSASDNLLINSLGGVGEELVVNGDFEDGVNDWGSIDDASLSAVDSTLTVTDVVGKPASQAQQVLLVDLQNYRGTTFEVSATFANGTSDAAQVLVESATQTLFSESNVSTSPVSFISYFTVPENETGELLIRLRSAGVVVGGTSFFSDVTVKPTTRNIGEIKNLTGYELVNRGE